MPVTRKKPLSTQSLTQPFLLKRQPMTLQHASTEQELICSDQKKEKKKFLMNHCPSICSFT